MRLASAAACGLLFLTAAPAGAYTATEAKNCMSDAFRLCSAEIPDVGRVAQCMHAKRRQLSPACATSVERFFAKGGSARHDNGPVVYRN